MMLQASLMKGIETVSSTRLIDLRTRSIETKIDGKSLLEPTSYEGIAMMVYTW